VQAQVRLWDVSMDDDGDAVGAGNCSRSGNLEGDSECQGTGRLVVEGGVYLVSDLQPAGLERCRWEVPHEWSRWWRRQAAVAGTAAPAVTVDDAAAPAVGEQTCTGAAILPMGGQGLASASDRVLELKASKGTRCEN
jgi:hypothetical protein